MANDLRRCIIEHARRLLVVGHEAPRMSLHVGGVCYTKLDAPNNLSYFHARVKASNMLTPTPTGWPVKRHNAPKRPHDEPQIALEANICWFRYGLSLGAWGCNI
jgi:hypothetical protein